MGVTITEDEADKRIRGVMESRKDVVRRHAQDTNAAEEINERGEELEATQIRNPDPSKAYRLVNRTKDGEYIARRQGVGYAVVDPKGKAKLINGVVKDDAQVIGDLVLMETPIENYEKRRQAKRAKWARMSGDKMEQTRENLNKIARDGGIVGRHKDAVIE